MDAIIRGSRWPADGSAATISVEHDSGWPAGYGAGITPSLILSRRRWGGTPDLAAEVGAVSINGDTLSVSVSLTAVQTAALPARGDYYAALVVGDDAFPITAPVQVSVTDAPGQGG